MCKKLQNLEEEGCKRHKPRKKLNDGPAFATSFHVSNLPPNQSIPDKAFSQTDREEGKFEHSKKYGDKEMKEKSWHAMTSTGNG